jgi:iron complex outermembrane receptor protein
MERRPESGRALRLAFPLTATCLAIAAHAQAPSPSTETLREIRVTPAAETATSPVPGYRARNATTGSKTDTPVTEIPQSITVIPREQMVDQGATNLQDALNYAAGVRSDAYGIDSRSDGFRVRGSYPDEYQDGLRRLLDWYTSNTRTDPFLLERIEVLRGPSSMLFGQGTTGGVVNMVSKRPQFERGGEIGLQLGSYGRKQLQLDLTGPLGTDWAYRLVALGRVADTQVDHVPDDRMLLAPSLTWKPNAMTSFTLLASWQKDKSGSTSQFFPWDGALLPNPNGRIPSSRFIGEPGFDRYDSERTQLGWAFEHRFNDGLALRQNTRFSRNEVDYRSIYGDSFSLPGGFAGDPVGRRLLGRFAFAERTRADVVAADQHLQADFGTGALRHKLLAGFDVLRYGKDTASAFDAPAYAGGGIPLIDVYNPVYTGFAGAAGGPLAVNPGSATRQGGIYLQDQLRWGPWIVVAGLRRDKATNSLEFAPDEKSSATTRRLGLMYQLPSGLTPYVSYAESFTPVAGTNFFGARFQPLQGEQWEAGVKYEPADKRFYAGAAVYKLKERNQQTPDPANPLNTLQAGTTKNDGVELEFRGRVTPAFDLIAHYNYTNVDQALEQLPAHQAAVWGKYRFQVAGRPGFSVGAGVRHMSAFADGVGAPDVPAVTLVDLLLAYETANWRYALNVNNLFDKTYLATCLNRGDCWFGARRNVIASATYRF